MNKLRCWPGCLARVIHSELGNEGRIVKVVRLLGAAEKLPGWEFAPAGDPHWVVEGRLVCETWGGTRTTERIRPFADKDLCPITPPPGSVTDSEVSELFSPSPAKESEKV